MTTESISAKIRAATAAHLGQGKLIRVMPGGSANMSVRVASKGSPDLVLRIYLQRDLDRFSCELETLIRLARIGAPTPRLESWGFACPVFGTPFLIYQLLPGEDLGAAARHLDASTIAAAIMPLMDTMIRHISALPVLSHGYLHTADGDLGGAGSQTHHQVDEYAAVIGRDRLADPSLLAAAVELAVQNMHLVSTDRPNLVHPDLKPGNIIIGPRGASIIDWELPIGGHPVLNYGGLLAEGIIDPNLRQGLWLHLDQLSPDLRLAAVTAGILRCLETLSYLPANPSVQNGRKVRPDGDDLANSMRTLLEWAP
ncbi:phosphotransferase [Solwaraspora sp. WMMD406]|uniref:phosphotransferase family protein n=1 Tax=Solwaraspora sp. WMMD406 TaxID=3016095 RepID=UPI002417D7C5|nr:phosphotransferase [Solwaraspora sp. WMMD406]MDG4767469.1 phosphotransferase [Solwaraspora sp. WMMD406]